MTGRWLVPLTASARSEITMILRSRMLWMAVAPLAALSLLLAFTSTHGADVGPGGRVADTAVMVNLLAGFGLAMAMADRFRWHRRTGLADLLAATPGSASARMAGTLTGSVAVALAPPAAALLVYAVVTAVREGSLSPVGASLASVVVILLPGGLLIAAFSALAGLVLPVTVARIGAAGVWGWATVLNSRVLPIPTVSYTMFSPAGGFPAVAWLGAPRSNAVLNGREVAASAAAVNILVVLACTLVLLAVARIWTERYR
uniref:Putative ABC permease n=1 Tax=Microbispora corallina TaxID=83302 RepID=E2IHA9_9ACTN|nr:putative ABC permease [Microbispora corallina]